MAKVFGSLIRSASLSGYAELVQSLGGNPQALLRKVGLPARLLQDPEALIPNNAVREALELAARATGAEDFALRLAARRSLSNLGPVSLVLREAATPREALDTLCRYRKLLNASLITRVDDEGGNTIVRDDLLPIHGLATRQSMELALGVMFRILTELINPGWRPRKVCFTHAPPANAAAHRAFFGCSVLFDQPFNGIVCAAADLRQPRGTQDPGIAASRATTSNPPCSGAAAAPAKPAANSSRRCCPAGAARRTRWRVTCAWTGARCTAIWTPRG